MVTQRTFDTTGTTLRRIGKVLTITCEDDATANRVADQLRTETDFTNHHNALKCPYCNPKGLTIDR